VTAHQSKRALPEHRKRPLIFDQQVSAQRAEKPDEIHLWTGNGGESDLTWPCPIAETLDDPVAEPLCVILQAGEPGQGG